jgi:hypothetical protein
MYKLLLAAAALGATATSAAAMEQQRYAIHATPPFVAHPMPQGVPYVMVGVEAKPIVTLRYGVINGRRVLLNGETMEVVYILHP